MSVKSVYNFVPAPKEKEVFKPCWEEQVNHDIPFSDGESGEIEIKITAETPIFIRNGHSKEDAELFKKTLREPSFKPNQEEQKRIDQYLSFSNYNGKYFIPATSLKGMFRNVLEIISNSKLSQINDHRHAIRQIMRTEEVVMDEGYELSQDDVKKEIQCGYLIRRGEKYYIHSCGKPLKIRYTNIDKKYNKDFKGEFGSLNKANIKENFANRTAAYKYGLLSGEELEGKFEIHPLNENDKQKSWVSKFQPLQYARFSDWPENDAFDGTIVLIGQASNYDVSTARKGEYVFRGKKSVVISDDRNRIEVSRDKIEDFKFINRDGKGESQELKDWSFWKGEIENGIPVFFRVKETKGAKEVLDFGLSFSYKQPAKYTTKDLLPKYSERMDLAEAIFGSIAKNTENKGRVFIGHAFCINNNPKLKDKVKVTLGSPKSSFTPFYLKQYGKDGKTNKFNTYNTGGELRGFKKYPIKNKIYSHEGESEKMQSYFIPLDKGNEFIAKIRFHNLRPIELGALLSAITLNDTNNTFHNLGYAKPLGYGQIKISNVKLQGVSNDRLFYSKIFQVEMLARYGSLWTQRINELITMSSTPASNLEIELEYNDLEDFQKIKDSGEYLQDYTSYGMNYNYSPDFQNEVQIRKNQLEQEEKNRIDKIKSIRKKIQELTDQKEFKDAVKMIGELANLEDVPDKIKWIQQLEELNIKNEEAKQLEKDRKRKEQEETNRLAEKNKKEKEDAIKLMEEMELDFKDDKFKTAQKVLKPPFDNKYFEYSEVQKDTIIEQIKKCWENDPKSFKKKKKANPFPKFPWSDIIKWIGEERAKSLYDELTK